MTSVGHTLTGIAIGVLCKPRNTSAKSTLAHLTIFAFLANIPDLPLPHWGHEQYRISHSIFVTLFLISILAIGFAFGQKMRQRVGGWMVIVGGALAWLSHLLLDSFYNHGYGIAIFWPFSNARLALPIPWFSVLPSIPPPFTWPIMRILCIEFISYFPLIILAIVLRQSKILQYAHNQN
jgi:inner membrane protein